MNVEFIEYTAGLFCQRTVGRPYQRNGRKLERALVRIEVSRLDDGRIQLHAVSGHNLERIPGPNVFVSGDIYDREKHLRPEQIDFAIWALNKCGWRILV